MPYYPRKEEEEDQQVFDGGIGREVHRNYFNQQNGRWDDGRKMSWRREEGKTVPIRDNGGERFRPRHLNVYRATSTVPIPDENEDTADWARAGSSRCGKAQWRDCRGGRGRRGRRMPLLPRNANGGMQFNRGIPTMPYYPRKDDQVLDGGIGGDVHHNNFNQQNGRWDDGRKMSWRREEGKAVPSRGNGGERFRPRNLNVYRATSRVRIPDENEDTAGWAGAGASRCGNTQWRGGRGGRGRRGGRMPLLPRNANGGMQEYVWHKVTIHNAVGQEMSKLLNSLQAALSLPLHPVGFSWEGSNAVFYLDSSVAANEIKLNIPSIPVGFRNRVNLSVRPSPPPTILLTLQLQERIKNVMTRRYNPETHYLDLKSFHRDAELHDTYVPLTRPNVAAHVLQTIGEGFPQTKALDLSENALSNLDLFSQLTAKAPNLRILILSDNQLADLQKLDAVSSLPLLELRLDNNPMCKLFENKTVYVNIVRKMFPSLFWLDGVDLTPPHVMEIKCAPETPDPTPNPSPIPFVQTGESIGDVASPAGRPADDATRFKQQMIESFSRQSGMKTDWSLKCLEDNLWDYNRAGLSFFSLQMEGKIPAEAFVKSVVVASLPEMASTSNEPDSTTKYKMIVSLSNMSRMKFPWSRKCLEDHQWDLNRAELAFSELNREGKIPKEAYFQ